MTSPIDLAAQLRAQGWTCEPPTGLAPSPFMEVLTAFYRMGGAMRAAGVGDAESLVVLAPEGARAKLHRLMVADMSTERHVSTVPGVDPERDWPMALAGICILEDGEVA